MAETVSVTATATGPTPQPDTWNSLLSCFDSRASTMHWVSLAMITVFAIWAFILLRKLDRTAGNGFYALDLLLDFTVNRASWAKCAGTGAFFILGWVLITEALKPASNNVVALATLFGTIFVANLLGAKAIDAWGPKSAPPQERPPDEPNPIEPEKGEK